MISPKSSYSRCLVVFATAVLHLSTTSVDAQEVEFLPHKAVYDLRLDKSQQGVINNMTGHISYDWTSVCRGWLVNNELDMTVNYYSGQSVTMGMKFNTWEARDGSRYRYAVKQGDNVSGITKYRGNAIRDESSQLVSGEITEPNKKVADLGQVVFPTAFLGEIIKAAKRGDTAVNKVVFDGTTELEAFRVSSIMLPHSGGSEIRELNGLKSWKVFLAYYDLTSKSTLPVQEQTLLMYENGVVTSINLNFGDYSVAGKLVEFSANKLPVCE